MTANPVAASSMNFDCIEPAGYILFIDAQNLAPWPA